MTEPRAGHSLRVVLDGEQVHLSVECHEPEGSQCRVTCAAGTCETYGYPDHEHGLKPAGGCNAVNYLNDDDIESCCDSSAPVPLHDGMSVEVEWDGDRYYWYPAGIRYGDEP